MLKHHENFLHDNQHHHRFIPFISILHDKDSSENHNTSLQSHKQRKGF